MASLASAGRVPKRENFSDSSYPLAPYKHMYIAEKLTICYKPCAEDIKLLSPIHYRKSFSLYLHAPLNRRMQLDRLKQ